MADQELIDRLRANIGDAGTPPAYDDAELGDLLDAYAGVEPRARYAALLPLWAEAAGYTNYTAGSASESLSQVFDQLKQLLDQAEHDVALVLSIEGATKDAVAPLPVAVPVEVYF